jgi:PAS domain S-box-containing protein
MKQKPFSKPTKRRGAKDSSTANKASESAKGRGSSSDYLQAIMDSIEDEIMVIDKDYRIVEANKAVFLRHGKSRQDVIGKHCYDVSHGLPELCCRPDHECPIKVVRGTGKPYRVTHIHVYQTGAQRQERYLDIIGSPITDSQGNVTLVVELMRDVTEAKELELRIAEANRSRQEVASLFSKYVSSQVDATVRN